MISSVGMDSNATCKYCKHYVQGDCVNSIIYKMLHERHEVGYLAAVSFTPDEDFFCKFWE